jgi:2-desacetyl-2-hydroxyethyl bacteriochlorophyllide A dehydrogenase
VKALVYLGPRWMELQEVPEPLPEPGEVVIGTTASAVCGSDLHAFREASTRRVPPLIMGHETVGTIREVGEGVDSARVGERVVLRPILWCGACDACRAGRTNLCVNLRLVGRDLPGGFAERFAVPARATVALSSDIADDVATLIEPLANAIHVTSKAIHGEEDVLVIGAGPIGSLVTTMAAARGAIRVLVTDRVATRMELARAQGGTPVGPERTEADVLEATGGRGVDVVIDAVGVEATWALALRAVRPGGRIEVMGLGAPSGQVDYFGVIGKEVSISGSFAWTDDEFAAALALIEAGKIETDGWFSWLPFSDGQRAFEDLVDAIERFKVILRP